MNNNLFYDDIVNKNNISLINGGSEFEESKHLLSINDKLKYYVRLKLAQYKVFIPKIVIIEDYDYLIREFTPLLINIEYNNKKKLLNTVSIQTFYWINHLLSEIHENKKYINIVKAMPKNTNKIYIFDYKLDLDDLLKKYISIEINEIYPLICKYSKIQQII